MDDKVERERLAALAALDVLDSAREPVFDDLARLAALTFAAPVALISLIDAERQWFKAGVGLDVVQTPRERAICDHTIRSSAVLVVPDARHDDRFRDNPLVVAEPGVRFYAGAPLITPEGHRVGSLCVIDFAPRVGLTATETDRLASLAGSVMQALTQRSEARRSRRTARMAADRQELLSLAEQMSGVGAWSWHRITNQTTWSDETFRIHGFEPGGPPPSDEDLLARYHPDDAPILATFLSRAVEHGEDFSLQARIVRPDGSLRHVITRASHRRDKTGAVVALFGAIQDVSDLKLADFALRDSEARLRFLTEHMSDLVMRYDLNFRRLFVSSSCRRYGYEPEELVGGAGFALNHPEDSPRLQALIDDLLAGVPMASEATVQIRFRAKWGEWMWMEGAPNLIRNAQGEAVEFVWVMRDISARKAAEIALAQSEARYRMLADRASDIIIRYDINGFIEYASPSVGQLGYTPEDMIGRNVGDFNYPDEETRARPVRDGLLAGRPYPEGLRTERRVIRADGTWAWFEGSPSTLFDEAGKIIGAVTVLRDISARRAMEDELRRKRAAAETAERSARLAAQIAGIGYWRLDLRTSDWFWSDDVYVIHGVPRDSGPMSGADAQALYLPEDQPILRAAVQRTRENGEPLDVTLRMVRPSDGEQRFIQTQAEVERDTPGEIVALFGVVRDVTDDVTARMRIEESEARYRILAERTTDIIMQYDSAGIVQYISPSVRQLGYEPEAFIGLEVAQLAHPEDRPGRREVINNMIAAPDVAPPPAALNEFRVFTADGRLVWLQGNPSPIVDEAGQAQGVVTVMRDVTARRAMEDELRRRQAEAEAATIAKSEFLANMSHEIRTPLTAVTGFAGLLQRMDGLPPKAKTFVDRINTGGQALLAIVDDILDFSKMEAGQIEFDPQPFDPAQFVRQTVELVRNEASRKGLDLSLAVSGSLPASVQGDSGRLGQVLLNLLNNAVKFTHAGRVCVSVSYSSGAGGGLRVEVADTGIGISTEQSDRLFQRFSQVDGSLTRQYGGSGLGLAISKGLVELMGGDIGVESEAGRGSTFWFRIPAPQVDPSGAPDAAGTQEIGLAPVRVLVVDDVPVNRELVSAILSPFGLALTEAGNGAEAVEAAEHTAFDVIVMDLQMPVMDGLAATRAIRATSALNRKTPILALSANVLPTQVEACREAGMDDHIAKPISAEVLLGKIALWIGPDSQADQGGGLGSVALRTSSQDAARADLG